MSRRREISPSFFTNEKVVSVGAFARLLFIGLWTEADREGRLEDRPTRLKMRLFPADSVDVSALLDDLVVAGLVERYESDVGPVIQVIGFSEHQHPHPKEAPSQLPPSREKTRQNAASREKELASPSGSSVPSGSSAGGVGEGSATWADVPMADAMAAALANLGISASDQPTVVQAWADDGFDVRHVVAVAAEVLGRRKRPRVVSASYLDPIVRQPAQPPPGAAGKRAQQRAATVAGLTSSGGRNGEQRHERDITAAVQRIA